MAGGDDRTLQHECSYSEMLTRMDEKVTQIHKWTFGNGQPGAAGRLAVIEQKVEELKQPRQWPAVAASIAAIVAVIWSFIQAK